MSLFIRLSELFELLKKNKMLSRVEHSLSFPWAFISNLACLIKTNGFFFKKVWKLTYNSDHRLYSNMRYHPRRKICRLWMWCLMRLHMKTNWIFFSRKYGSSHIILIIDYIVICAITQEAKFAGCGCDAWWGYMEHLKGNSITRLVQLKW